MHVSPKAFNLLGVLLSASPRALAKEELHDAIWPDTYVEESNLPGLIAELRSALEDGSKNPRFIRTVHGFGYAFCGTLSSREREPAARVVFRGLELPLFEGENVLGRDLDTGLRIDDHTVSRRHARIIVEGDAAFLEDLASKNGTVLDGKEVHEKIPLNDGQTIILGDARIVFRRGKNLGSTVTLTGG